MADEKDEIPDLNEDLPEDEAGDDFFSTESDDDFFSESVEEEGPTGGAGESFEEIGEDDGLSIAEEEDIFSSDLGEDFALEEESVPETPQGGSLLGGILGDEGEEEITKELEDASAKEAPKKKKTSPLLLLLLLLAAAYGAYVYVIPNYFPELLSYLPPATPTKTEAPKRVAVKAPPKKVAPKPVPVEKPKLEAPKKIEAKGIEPVKAEVVPAPVAPPVKKELKAETAPKQKLEKTTAKQKEEVRVTKTKSAVKGDQDFFIRAGAYIFKNNLKDPVSRIKAAGYTPRIETAYKSIEMNRLTAGKWDSLEEAKRAILGIRKQGAYKDAKVLPIEGNMFTVLIASYYYKHLAVEESIILEVQGFDTEIVKKPVKMKIYHILLGPYADAEEAGKVESVLKKKGLEAAVFKKNKP